MNILLKSFALLMTASLLSACERPGTYPITGAECGPNDPVRTMEPINCVPPV